MASERFVSDCPPLTSRESEIMVILNEEVSEIIEQATKVQQRASKMLRFGRDEIQEGQALTNAERLADEVGDFIALMDMAIDAGLMSRARIAERVPVKRAKLFKYMQTRPV